MTTENLLLGLYEGRVTNRDDPEGLSRVKIIIPGTIEPETPQWVQPLGMPGGGSAQRGTFDPPAVNANVAVMFVRGNPDQPRYWYGAWGIPGGATDVPTNAALEEGTNRQNIVTEDEEWRIERDSRSAPGQKRYLIRHKGSSLAVLVDGTNDKVFLVREAATQALVRGTQYRSAEQLWINGLFTALNTFAGAVASATTVAQVAAAGSALQTALGLLSGFSYLTDATAFLSTKAFTE